MNLANAIVIIVISGTRQSDGMWLIDDQRHPRFPPQIVVEGFTFDFTEVEEVDPKSIIG